MTELLTQFHFLRPLWLLAIVPALLLTWLLRRQRHSAGNWKNLIAPELLPWLLEGSARRLPHLGRWCLAGWLLACLGLAGPTWQQTPLPVHKQETPLVILLDLSPSMLAQDIKPDRLTRARLKLIDLLKARKEGTTALVAFAGDAHIVSPLTDDANTIISLASTLSPDIMPVPGSNAEAAMETGLTLAMNAGYLQGDVLLITDGLTRKARETLESQLRGISGFRLSILGLGTAEGAPVPLPDGGFAKDRQGGIVIARLNTEELKKFARRHGGRFSTITGDDRDITHLSAGMNNLNEDNTKELQRQFDTWDDRGYWLALLLLPLALLAFRKGLLASLILAPLLLQSPYADAFSWDDLWLRRDQQDRQAFEQGKKAYQQGDFDNALNAFKQNDSADSHYNRGNALAKSGKLEEALKAYDKALETNPQMEDATFNRKLVEQLLQQKQQQDNPPGEPQKDQPGDRQNNQPNKQQPGDQDNPQPPDPGPQNENGQAQEQPAPEEQEQEPEQQKQNGQSQKQSPQQESTNQQPAEEKETGEASSPQQKPGESREEKSAEEQQAIPQPEEGERSEEEQQALEQWLRRVPDDPGGLLRRKFHYESRRRALEQRRGYNSPPDQYEEERW